MYGPAALPLTSTSPGETLSIVEDSAAFGPLPASRRSPRISKAKPIKAASEATTVKGLIWKMRTEAAINFPFLSCKRKAICYEHKKADLKKAPGKGSGRLTEVIVTGEEAAALPASVFLLLMPRGAFFRVAHTRGSIF